MLNVKYSINVFNNFFKICYGVIIFVFNGIYCCNILLESVRNVGKMVFIYFEICVKNGIWGKNYYYKCK